MTARKRKHSSFDVAMAALSALAVAFAVFAMPDPYFAQAVAASGLPALIPAAQPPLGMTARLASVALGAIGTFALVWLVLRALGGNSAPRRRPERQEIDIAAPRLRRADAHPDAPSRRPIFAGLDLGEPIEGEDRADDGEEDDILCLVEEAPQPGLVAEAEWQEEAEPAEFPLEDEIPQDSPHAPEEELSITQLMQRLETGLVRRERKLPWVAEEAANMDPHPLDERLRSAITDLQRLAARN